MGILQLSENHLQRKLNLPRRSRGLADNPKPAAAQDVRRSSEVHDVEDVEELCAKFECAEFCVAAAAEGSVFDQRHVEIVEAGPAERAPAQRSEAAVVGAGSVRQVDGNVEE